MSGRAGSGHAPPRSECKETQESALAVSAVQVIAGKNRLGVSGVHGIHQWAGRGGLAGRGGAEFFKAVTVEAGKRYAERAVMAAVSHYQWHGICVVPSTFDGV